MKGSAAYLEAAELHGVCAELEAAADARNWDRIDADMGRLTLLLDEFHNAGYHN